MESVLHQVGSVVQMAWHPYDVRDPNMVDEETGKLMGLYHLKVQQLDQRTGRNEHPIVNLAPLSDWVE